MPLLSRPALALLALVALLLLAGCLNQPSSPAPPPMSTTSFTVSPDALREEIPELEVAGMPVAAADMERDDESGAAAAAVYFMELWSYTMQTGDVAAWDEMSGELCRYCWLTRTAALSMQDAGDTYTGGVITATGVHSHPYDEVGRTYPVDVEVMISTSTHRSATGELITVGYPSEVSDTFRVDVTHRDDGWEVLEVQFLPES